MTFTVGYVPLADPRVPEFSASVVLPREQLHAEVERVASQSSYVKLTISNLGRIEVEAA